MVKKEMPMKDFSLKRFLLQDIDIHWKVEEEVKAVLVELGGAGEEDEISKNDKNKKKSLILFNILYDILSFY